MEPEHDGEDAEMPLPSDLPIPVQVSGRGWLGRRRRQMTLVIAIIGLATFVDPLITTDTPVLGRTRWSPLQVVMELHKGTLPPDLAHQFEYNSRAKYVDQSVDALLGFSVIYVLLLAIAGAAVLFPSTRLVGSAAAVAGAWVLGEGRSRYSDLQEAIYGAPSAFVSGHQVHARVLALILLGVLVLLMWIATNKALNY